MTDTALHVLPLEQLFPSPTNPRKTFDPVALQELAQSLREKGLIQPIVVRPQANGKKAVRYEVVAGERRYRAAGLAELGEVPCIVRELDDVAVLEIQVVENNQREDVHPLEEADGFARLMKVDGYNVDRIAQKIGLSSKYVYDRVKLLQLTPEAKKVFLEGEITAGHAILLARLTPTEQRNLMKSNYSGLWTANHSNKNQELNLEGAPPHRSRKAVSVRELAAAIERTVRFKPEENDLPNLFPDTAVQLEVAEEQELKVIKITREYRVPDQAKDPKERTYGSDHWLRVDGEPDTKGWGGQKPLERCEHAVMGVVVAGPGRGEAFLVCVAKKKCDHWKSWRAEREKRKAGSSSNGRDSWAEQDRKWREQRAKEQAEQARWKKAGKELAAAVTKAIEEGDGALALNVIEDELAGWGGAKKMTKGTVDERLRAIALRLLTADVTSSYPNPDGIAHSLKLIGVDAKKIVDQVAPKERKKKEPKKPTSKNAKKKAAKAAAKKGGARSRRRTKKASADVSKAAE